MSVTLAEQEDRADPNSGTGAGMIAFLNYLIAKNEMVEASASALRTGCRKVLDVEAENWATVDIRTLDVDALIQRFRNKNRAELKERSLYNYEMRFRSTAEMYLKWLADDPTWKPTTRARNTTAKKERVAAEPGNVAGASAGSSTVSATLHSLPPAHAPEVPGVTMITYPLPLRPGVKVQLVLPDDLTAKEAKRVANFVSALAFEEQLQIEAGPAAYAQDE